MTAYAVREAFSAHEENLSRLAYRTAFYTRVQPKHLPKSEDAMFSRKKAKPQSIREQWQKAREITVAMGGSLH